MRQQTHAPHEPARLVQIIARIIQVRFPRRAALRELGLPAHGLLLSLFGFNLGVEVGQGLVVAACLPVLALLHRTRSARAAYDEAAATYKSTVITAFQNVADSLRAIQSDADAVKTAAYAEQAAATTLDITRKQLQAGQIAYLSLLTAEGAYYQTLINLVVAKANRYADTAALFQALGGGWWNRSDVVKKKGRGGPPPQKPFLE